MTAMTHFVFGRVAPGGGSLGGDPTELMDGAWSAQEPDRAPDGSGDSIEDYLVGRAHAAGTKALLMLGGDGADGRGFLKSTATPQLQGEFVDNIVDYLVEHDYDGVDLDWENCLDGHPDCVDEGEDPVTAGQAQQRLLGLIDAIRAEMATRDRYAATPGLLTFPGYATKINENGGRPERWQTDVALQGRPVQPDDLRRRHDLERRRLAVVVLRCALRRRWAEPGRHLLQRRGVPGQRRAAGPDRDRHRLLRDLLRPGHHGAAAVDRRQPHLRGPGRTALLQRARPDGLPHARHAALGRGGEVDLPPVRRGLRARRSTRAATRPASCPTRTSSPSPPRGSGSGTPASAARSCGRSTTAGCRAPAPTR